MSIHLPDVTLVPPDSGADADSLRAEYQEVNGNVRSLSDIRFRLLAFIPALSGAGIYLLTAIGDPTKKTLSPCELLLSKLMGTDGAPPAGLSPFDAAKVMVIGGLGFLATLGVVYYDQRNSELYNALISRARFLERELGFERNPNVWRAGGGQFNERPERGRRLLGLFTLGHDTGLALIYAGALGGWLFPFAFAVASCLSKDVYRSSTTALGVAAVGFLLTFEELLRMDRPWRYRWADFGEWRTRRHFRKQLRALQPRWINVEREQEAQERQKRLDRERRRLVTEEGKIRQAREEKFKQIREEQLRRAKVEEAAAPQAKEGDKGDDSKSK